MQIGFIGLGNLGAILVRNLVDKEYKLHLSRIAQFMEL